MVDAAYAAWRRDVQNGRASILVAEARETVTQLNERASADPNTGRTYNGPPEDARLAAGERVIADEAGMLDQDTAIASQIRGVTFDMTGLHRFTNPEYAALTLQIRDGDKPAETFDRLQTMGLICLHDSEEALREHIAEDAAPHAAVTLATNEEVRELNARIQALRLARGELDHARAVTGRDGLDIGVGDVIQAGKNASAIGVANRQAFTVQHVTDDGAVYAVGNGDERKRQQTVKLPAVYVAEHAHLAYASTAYGVQGVTVDNSHTVLDEAISAAGLYVGLTRGIINDGPIRFVNAERDRLTKAIARSEAQAAKWDEATRAIAEQQLAEQQELRVRIYGENGRAPDGGPAKETARWRGSAETLRRTLNEIEVLSPGQAAQLIRQRQAEAEARRAKVVGARADRAARLDQLIWREVRIWTGGQERQLRCREYGWGALWRYLIPVRRSRRQQPTSFCFMGTQVLHCRLSPIG